MTEQKSFGGFTNPDVLAVLEGQPPRELNRRGLIELWWACAAEAQEFDELQVWAEFDDDEEVTSVDLFDDTHDVIQYVSHQKHYVALFNDFGRWVTSLIDDNWAVDIDFERPESFSDPAVRSTLVTSVELSDLKSKFLKNLAAYVTACLG